MHRPDPIPTLPLLIDVSSSGRRVILSDSVGQLSVANPSLLGPSRHRRGRLGGAQSLPPDALEHGSAAVCTGIVAADSAAPQAFLLVQKRCLQQASRAVLPSSPIHRKQTLPPRLGLASRKSPRRRNHLSSDVSVSSSCRRELLSDGVRQDPSGPDLVALPSTAGQRAPTERRQSQPPRSLLA